MDNLISDTRELLSDLFYDKADYFYTAWRHARPINELDAPENTFSKWIKPDPESISIEENTFEYFEKYQSKLISELINVGLNIIHQNKDKYNQILETRINNSGEIIWNKCELDWAHSLLYLSTRSHSDYLPYKDRFSLDNCYIFKVVAAYYYCLSVVYDNYEKSIDFLKEKVGSGNPVTAVELMREDISDYGYQLVGFWCANSQEVRGFVDKWKKQIAAASEGGKTRATDLTVIMSWKDMAINLKKKNPNFSKRSIAELIAKKTGASAETIRKKI